jgi:NADP-dependent 3-hydroxy acid dehydrogenase YdfG
MDRWRGRTALITGASAGIGLATVEALAKHGVNVIGCARNVDKINELSSKLPKGSANVRAIRCDLTKEEDIIHMFQDIEKNNKVIDILINNAGMAKEDTVIAGKTEQWKDMIDVNVLGLSICAREALRLMENNHVDDGHIINLNSMAGHEIPSIPQTHFYSATKHMVTALTEALYMELRAKKSKIRITSLSPGAVHTEFAARWLGEKIKEFEPLMQFKTLVAEDIADAVVYVLGAPAHVNVKELIIAPTEQPLF